MRLILASASPRRIELIKKLKYLDVEVRPANVEEHTDKTDDKEAVMELAERKARAIKSDGLVLGADTMVVARGKRLGKPKTAREAREMFGLLCGAPHKVLTGVCLIRGGKIIKACEETAVEFAEYDESVVSAYIATGKPFDKAGGYGVQDAELAPLIVKITGDYDNVLGLPTALVDALISENYK